MKNKIKKFRVKSDDPILLEAFERKLVESNVMQIINSNSFFNTEYITIFVRDNDINYAYGYSGKDDITFNLPHQWVDALKYLNKAIEQTKKPTYMINDWVVLNNGNIVKLNEVFNDNWFYYKYNDLINLISKEHIQRTPTNKELYNHLLKQTNIKIGDKITHGHDIFRVNSIKLFSEENENSLRCKKYYKEYGDHLTIINNFDFAQTRQVPLPECEVVNDISFSIKTDKDEYTPIYNEDNNTYDIGCIKDIDLNDLFAFKRVMDFCKKNHMNINFTYRGDMNKINITSTLHNNYSPEKIETLITKNMINELSTEIIKKNENK